MSKRQRPALYWKALLVAGPMSLASGLTLALNGLGWLAAALVALAALVFFGPWLLAPYSKTAHRVLVPPDEDFQRVERFADRLGKVPIFGVVWRWAERATGNSGRQGAEEYRSWRRDRGD